jgi:hypothetical protein
VRRQRALDKRGVLLWSVVNSGFPVECLALMYRTLYLTFLEENREKKTEKKGE